MHSFVRSPRCLRHLTEFFPARDQKCHHFPQAYLEAIDAKASCLSAVGKDCRVLSGLFPLRFAHLEKLFSDEPRPEQRMALASE
jgi:hypothetical protein